MTSAVAPGIDVVDVHPTTATSNLFLPHEMDIGGKKTELAEKAGADLTMARTASNSTNEGNWEIPTDEDWATLRKVPGKISAKAASVAIIEGAERFSYYGSTVSFTNFIQRPLPPGSRTGAGYAVGLTQSGALGRGQRTATALTTFNSFFAYVMPILGAYLADAHWGRYRTIQYAIVAAIIGHIILVVSAVPSVIAAPSTSLGVFTLGIITIGLGTGGFKSNVSILIAEQYTDPAHIKTLPSGERVIVDPVTTASRLYLYFYMAINFGALFGQITMSFASNYVGFWLGWTLPTIIFSFCPLVMWFFRKQYVKTPPTESVVAKAAKAFSLCLKGRGSWNPIQFYRNCKADSFWQNAKPSVLLARGETLPSYMNWDDQWIDELRRGVKSCAVFTFMPLFWLCYNQNTGNLTSQAATMDRGQVPNDIISNLNPITLIIFIPICDKFLYPFLARKGIDFTPIKRITCGFFLGAAAMIWAAVTQHYIYKTGACGKYVNTCEEIAYAPINVWVQTGSYVLIGFSEIFASVTCLEYAYTNSPSNLRSVVMSLFLFSSAIASALGQAFVALSDDPLLVWNYVVMAILATVGGIIFWFTFRSLDAEQNKLTRLEKSTFVGKTKDFEEM